MYCSNIQFSNMDFTVIIPNTFEWGACSLMVPVEWVSAGGHSVLMTWAHHAQRRKTSGTTICECSRRTRETPQISTAPPHMVSHRGLAPHTLCSKLLRLRFLAPSCETKGKADIWQAGEWQGQILDRRNSKADTVVRMRPLWTTSPWGEVVSVSAGPVQVRVVCVCVC